MSREVALRGNQLLRLDDPDSGWLLESGSLGLFGVTYAGGSPGGARRFFFTLEAGEALFGVGPVDPDRQGLVGVALEDSRLIATTTGLGLAAGT